MITEVTSIEELKQIFSEILFNHTDAVTKITDNSVLNGIAFGCAKVGQKAIKDIAVLESHIYPDSAYGIYLDNIAANYGIASRFGASNSSTYIRLVGTPGTVYILGVNTFMGNDGVIFNLEETIVIPALGYAYAKIRSQQIGDKTNINALTLNKINPIPSGHQYCINEYRAIGGRDIEDDSSFRIRIKEGSNILARGTISMLEQVFMKLNNNVLKIKYQGINNSGKVIISILTQNGIDLTSQELDQLLEQGEKFFALTELKPLNTQNYGIILQNIEYFPIDVNFRCEIMNNYNPDDIREQIQIKFAKKYDIRYWNSSQKIIWADLLQIVKDIPGIKYVPDNTFYPNIDVAVDMDKVPRFRSFLMLDLKGNIIINQSGTLNPIFYQNNQNSSYQTTVFNTIF